MSSVGKLGFCMSKSKIRVKRLRQRKVLPKTGIKIKSKRAAQKRYKVTGSGKVKVGHTGKRHLTGFKSRSQKNRLKKLKVMRKENMLLVKRCMPNSF